MTVIVGQTRACRVCGAEKHYPFAFGYGNKLCKDCRRIADRPRLAARKVATAEKRRADRLARKKLWRDANRHESVGTRRGACTPRHDQFGASVSALESQWGPYATWTREQHATHSKLLRMLAGVPEDIAPDARKVAA